MSQNKIMINVDKLSQRIIGNAVAAKMTRKPSWWNYWFKKLIVIQSHHKLWWWFTVTFLTATLSYYYAIISLIVSTTIATFLSVLYFFVHTMSAWHHVCMSVKIWLMIQFHDNEADSLFRSFCRKHCHFLFVIFMSCALQLLCILHNRIITRMIFDKTNKMTCASREDSGQPGHPPSLIRVFAVRMKKPWALSYPLSAQRRLIRQGECPGYLSLHWAHISFCWFCRAVAHLMTTVMILGLQTASSASAQTVDPDQSTVDRGQSTVWSGSALISVLPAFYRTYHNDPKYLDRQIWANSADPDQTAPRRVSSSLIRVYTVCHSLCIIWMHYSKLKPPCLTFRMIKVIFWVSEFFWISWYFCIVQIRHSNFFRFLR